MPDTLVESFEKNGYLIFKDNSNVVNKLRSNIISILKKKNNKLKSKTDDFVINNFHKFYSKKNLNEIRYKLYNNINLIKGFGDLYYKCSKKILDRLIGNEVAIQKKINLSIQMPNDPDSLLDMHSDIYAGESPFQVVVWIPMVDVKGTKSMFFTTPKTNKRLNNLVLNSKKKTVREIYQKNKKKFKFLNLKFGEILIFSPLILHGNTINRTKETRFSLNCRFKSLLSPYDVIVKSHRNIPQFYRPLNIKPMTKIGFKYLMKYEKN
tara:strand:+ start:270 stop:1064 length:795 start_codon:yes stop_codon:yes gene_type:complete